jgi:hypothetical protein
MAWVAKGSGGLPLLILHAVYRQRVLMTSQQVHAATILMWQAIITGEGSYRLSVFFSVPPLSFSNMLLTIMRSSVWLFLTPLTCPPCWPFLFSGLDMGPFLLFLVFPSFGCFVLIKFDTVWSLDSIGFPKGCILMKLEKILGHKQVIGKQRYIFLSCTCRAAH